MYFRLFFLIFMSIVIFPISAQEEIDCDAVLEIWEIQGERDEPNCFGERVETHENIVTAITPEGFFIQTPDDRVDENDRTSNGLYILTGLPPINFGVQVGDLVNVEGRVREFFFMTRIEATSRRRVEVLDSGMALPDPVDLLSVDRMVVDGVHPMERFESMLVAVEDVAVTAPTNRFDEFGISLTGERTFREPGIELDAMPELVDEDLPVWDLNVELIEVDPDEAGQDVVLVSSGARANISGPLGYSYLDYQIWATELEITEETSPARVVRSAEANEISIGTQNAENLFDAVDDPEIDDGPYENYTPETEEDYQIHLRKLSLQIRQMLGAPDIVALQEVENTRTLEDLRNQIEADDPEAVYETCLIEGNDTRGIDVAYLINPAVVTAWECYEMPDTREARFGGNSPVFDRLPLILDVEMVTEEGESLSMRIMNVHLKSLGGVETTPVQTQRLLQAEMIATYIQAHQVTSDVPFMILGDLNAFQFSDGLVDVVNIIAGTAEGNAVKVADTDWVEPNLVNQLFRLPETERYSFIWNGHSQALDHILTTQNLDPLVVDVQASRGNADAHPELHFDMSVGAMRSADHDGLVIFIAP